MLTIYDAVAWDTMPHGEPILVYADPPPAINTMVALRYLNPPQHWTVCAVGNTVADIADVESGDMSPGRAAFGVRMGWWHTVYCSLDTLPSVQSAMKAQGSPSWFWFAADPTGVPHLPPGAAACQYAWHSLNQCPANYDMSCATERWVAATRQPHPMRGARIMGITQLNDGRIAIDAIGAAPNDGHQFLWTVDEDGSKVSMTDLTDAVGAKGPGNTLYTVK